MEIKVKATDENIYLLYKFRIFGVVLNSQTWYSTFDKQGIKMESFPKCDFIPVDYYEVRHVKSSFKKLMRACVPSSPFNENERGFLKAMEETEWLPQVEVFHY